MNQTKKRLAIIKLAISMTDTETIQLQVLKLGLLKTDSKMRDILSLLNEHNYAQAQQLISTYIDAPSETTVVQRTSQEDNSMFTIEPSPEEAMIERKEETSPAENTDKKLTLKEKIQLAKDKAIIEQFQLFTETDNNEEATEKTIDNYDEYLDIAPKPKKMSAKLINYDSLLNVHAEDVMPKNINLDISDTSKEDFLEEELHITSTSEEPIVSTDAHSNTLEKDIIPDPIEIVLDEPAVELNENSVELPTAEVSLETTQDADIDIAIENPTEEQIEEPIISEEKESENIEAEETKTEEIEPREILKESENSKAIEQETTVETKVITYKAISYIDQKFKNMHNQYSPIFNPNKSFDSVDALLLKIANEGYTEAEVEETIKHIDKISSTNKSEAAQLLLILGATESKYAQFRMARALFQGKLVHKNLPEAFTLINRLAMNDDFPEAICDLAQFYENGIGIDKDKKKAQELYKQAMDLGIHRAIGHYERILKKNKSLFSFFKK